MCRKDTLQEGDNMKLLTTFVLIGTVDSKDDFFATVEINMNPVTHQVGHAVLPVRAFPCESKEGDIFYTSSSSSVIA